MSLMVKKLGMAAAGANTEAPVGDYFAVFNNNGTSPWTDAEFCIDVTTDSRNQVYSLWGVGGSTSYNIIVLKQDENGSIQWKRYFSWGASGAGWTPTAVRCDSSDRPHVLFWNQSGPPQSGELHCLNPSTGATNFSTRWTDTDQSGGYSGFQFYQSYLAAQLMEIDNDTLYMCGNAYPSPTTRKNLSLIYSIGSSSYTLEVATEIGPDSDNSSPDTLACGTYNGNLIAIVVLYGERGIVTHNDSGTQQGNTLNLSSYGSSSSSSYIDKNTGNIYLIDFANSEVDFLVVKYNSSGTKQWEKKFTENTTYVSRVLYYYNGLTVDADENVYVNFTAEKNYWRNCVMKLNSSGTLQWVQPITWSQNTDIFAQRIHIDQSGSLYATSSSRGALIKFPSDGSLTGSWSGFGSYSLTLGNDNWVTEGSNNKWSNLSSLGAIYVSGTQTPRSLTPLTNNSGPTTNPATNTLS